MTGASLIGAVIEDKAWCDAARLAAFAFAICSRRAADDFLLVAPGGEPADSTVGAVDVGEALDGLVSSAEVVEDLWDAREAFREAPAGVDLSRVGIEGFLKRPVTDGLAFAGLEATVFDPYRPVGTGSGRFSGLGVLDRVEALPGGGWTLLVDRTVPPGVTRVEGVFRGVRLARPRTGVPSMVLSLFL